MRFTVQLIPRGDRSKASAVRIRQKRTKDGNIVIQCATIEEFMRELRRNFPEVMVVSVVGNSVTVQLFGAMDVQYQKAHAIADTFDVELHRFH